MGNNSIQVMMNSSVSMVQSSNLGGGILSKIAELAKLFKQLGYKNYEVFRIGEDIIKECVREGKGDIIISRTGENELLIYRKLEGGYRNIILDKDGDMEYLHIPEDRSETYNEFVEFHMITGQKIKELVNKL